MKRLLRLVGSVLRIFTRTRRRTVISVVAAFLMIGVTVIVHYLDAPAQGHQIAAVDALKVIKATPKTTVTPAQKLSSNLFSLSLPPGYNVQRDDPTPSNLLYNQTITKPGAFGTTIIALAIQNMPQGGLDGDASYTFRLQQSSVYSMSVQQYGSDTVHIASDVSSGSVVAFWPHDNYLATISLSSGTDSPAGDNNADELNSLKPILAAWQWQ